MLIVLWFVLEVNSVFISCLSAMYCTLHSTTGRKLRLDIGLKEPISSGLIAFFSRGRTNACFKESGKSDSLNNALHISASTDASNGSRRLSSQVGIESKEQCLDGAALTILLISSGVTGLKADRLVQGRSSITGSGAAAVAWHILSTLERKNAAKSSAEWGTEVDSCGVLSSK